MYYHANSIIQGLWFSDVKDLVEISTASPPKGSPNRGRVGWNGDFWPVSRYISKMVQDRNRQRWLAFVRR